MSLVRFNFIHLTKTIIYNPNEHKINNDFNTIIFAIIGVSLTFAPDNISRLLGVTESTALSVLLQLLGAAYYAFSILNWMAKGAIIGGIYNRPIASANLTHFLIGGLALTKVALSSDQIPVVLSVMAGFYMVAAGVFGVLITRHPSTVAA